MDVYSFDGKRIGSAGRLDGGLLTLEQAGRELRVRADAIYEQNGSRVVLICYAEGLPFWCISD